MELLESNGKRKRDYCEHCDKELSRSQYYDYKKRYCKIEICEIKSENSQCAIDDAPDLSSTCDLPDEKIPLTDNSTLLSAINGLSRQLSEFAANVYQELKAINEKLQALDDRLNVTESNGCSTEELKRKRRLQNPEIAEAVRRLHKSEANCRRYDPEQGLSSPYNEMVTSFLVGALVKSPEFQNDGLDKSDFVVACKTYYETVRRNFRYKQPELASVAAANKSSARSRQRRKRLLEARQSVLAADEVDFWKGITLDMMSDEEDGDVDGVSGWIVRPPSFRSEELSNLCAKLQARLEASSKYAAVRHKRLQTGSPSNRTPPHSYDPEAATRHFAPNVMPRT